MHEFSKTLRRLAEKCGKSELDLAELTGLDPSFIHRLTTGEKGPSPLTIVRLSIALPMCRDLVEQDRSEIPNILSVLNSAHFRDAVAKSLQSRNDLTGA
ncbi:MAG: helix-turn-helix domain-containing protein [Thermomicrobiales bacterium]